MSRRTLFLISRALLFLMRRVSLIPSPTLECLMHTALSRASVSFSSPCAMSPSCLHFSPAYGTFCVCRRIIFFTLADGPPFSSHATVYLSRTALLMRVGASSSSSPRATAPSSFSHTT
ncbi:hypothetical protein R3P38DRAFT_2996400, partial [Favolaschia claudopus]